MRIVRKKDGSETLTMRDSRCLSPCKGMIFHRSDFHKPYGLMILSLYPFLKKKENLIRYGAVRTGKTHLSIALGVKAINQGKRAVLYRVHDLINQLESEDMIKVARIHKKIN